MVKRMLAGAAVVIWLVALVHAQPAPEPANPPAEAPPWNAELRDVAIPMRDGKALAANVLLPAKPGKYPCVLVQTPYNKDKAGREMGDVEKATDAARGSAKAWSQFDREHYAYCFVDWRGFFASRRAMEGVNKRQWKRGQDGYDCVEWCAAQAWCDGKVGTWGGSALGKQQFDTAAEQPPHLICCAPLIAYQGSRYESYYEGAVPLEAHIKALDRLGFGVGEAVLAARGPDRPIWRIARNMGYTPSRIQVPCLMISGWWDNYPRDVIAQYEDIIKEGGSAAKQHSRLVMGPWSHTAIDMPEQGDLVFKDAESYSTQITLKFFDYFLRDQKDNGYDKLARVHAFQCGEGWKTGASWLALCGKGATRYLHSDLVIRATPEQHPAEAPVPMVQFRYDPKNASPTIGGQNLPPLTHGPKECSELEKRKDVLVYATPALEEPLGIRGEVVLKVRLSCNRKDCDLHARLLDCTPEGKCFLVSETIQRAKWRDGKSAQLLEPGKTVELTLRFAPHAYTWVKGHKLKLLLTGGNSPRFERNSHTGEDAWNAETALVADVQIDHLSEIALELPVAP
ncbi:MAG: CocE/NonD family hydrolase [Planctomycetes bacterium]|nr:CocE/NonD family hydrolase [Planctomycetota bacterium]